MDVLMILAFLVGMALLLATPGKEVVLAAALIERDQLVGAIIAPLNRDLCYHSKKPV